MNNCHYMGTISHHPSSISPCKSTGWTARNTKSGGNFSLDPRPRIGRREMRPEAVQPASRRSRSARPLCDRPNRQWSDDLRRLRPEPHAARAALRRHAGPSSQSLNPPVADRPASATATPRWPAGPRSRYRGPPPRYAEVVESPWGMDETHVFDPSGRLVKLGQPTDRFIQADDVQEAPSEQIGLHSGNGA